MFKIPNIKICFSNKQKNIKSRTDLETFCDDIGLDHLKLTTVNQIHSSNIISAKLAGNYDCYDGIVNFGGKLVCSIKVADCLPIYFVNSISRTIGLLHAGWRGLSSGIIKKYLEKVSNEVDDFSNTFALIGPSIQNCCFRIQEDVIKYFDSKFYSKIDDIHFQVDLQEWALNQMLASNIRARNVFIIKSCTYCNKSKYHSYRRDGRNAGRMYAIMGWEQ